MRKVRLGKRSVEDRRQALRRLFYSQPSSKKELWLWVKAHFGVELTREAVCDHHQAQLDYLWYTTQQMGDSYVLACRNGGKTQMAAIATVYDSEFHSPCSTISVAGCVHPNTPLLTPSGFKPIINARVGDMSFDGEQWQNITGVTERPPIQHLKISFVGLPPLFVTHSHPVIRSKGIECPIEGRTSPRVCSTGVKCAYHRRRFKCKGRGTTDEVPASELSVGDALIFPLNYASCQSGFRIQTSPLLQGLMFGSHVKRDKHHVTFYKRYSISREYDKGVLDQVREIIARVFDLRPVRQEPAGHAFALRYDARFFKDYNISDSLPRNFFMWSEENKNEFMDGVMSGTKFNLCNVPSYNKAFSTTRNTEFALNLYALIAHSRPRYDHWDADDMHRLIVADSSILKLKKNLPASFAMLKPRKKRAGSQALLELNKWGRSLGNRIKSIEEVEPSVPFVDIEIEGGERFMTLWGIVHNSKLQAGHLYNYLRKIYDPKGKGIAREDAEQVMKEGTTLKNGSTVQIIASSQEAAGGFHVDHIRMDQIDDMKRGVFDTLQFDINMASADHVQVDMVGTWDKLGGLYDKVLHGAIEKGQKVFKWCLLDVIEPCRDRMCSMCDLSDCCGGVARDKFEGFLKIENAIKLRRRLISDEIWGTQALLKSPRSVDALIPKFNDTHPFVQHVGFNPVFDTFRGFDWARCPSAVWVQFDEHNDRIYIIDEYMGKPGAGAIVTGKAIRAKESREGYRNTTASYGDPAGASWIRDFNSMGISVISLVVDKDTRLAVLDHLLKIRPDGNPGVIISSKCVNLRSQLLQYDVRCRLKQRGAPQDDMVDALLYLLGGLRF